MDLFGPLTRAVAVAGVLAVGTFPALAGPADIAALEAYLGTWNGNACQLLLTKDNAVQGSAILGSASAPGNLCVRIYDVGQFTEATDYEVTVVHP